MRYRTVTSHLPVEAIMKSGMLMALVGILLAVSACVVEPYGGGGPGYYYGGGHYEHDYGRPVWHQ
jgi:hypothetical protein